MIKFYIDQKNNKYFKYKDKNFYKINKENNTQYIIDDYGKDILKKAYYGGFSYIDISYEKKLINLGKGILKKNILKLEKDNIEIILTPYFDIVEKRFFNNGRCIEFAFILYNFLKKSNIKNIEYGQITGLIEKDNKYIEEVRHGVISIKNTKFFIDVDGINIFDEKNKELNLKNFGFSKEPKKIFLKVVNEKTFVNTYQILKKHNITQARQYLKQNKNFLNVLIFKLNELTKINKKKDNYYLNFF